MLKKLKIVVQGCCHGELDEVYKCVPDDADLLIICGDFQALRNTSDFNCLNVPCKYKKLGDFHNYYNLKKKAKIITLFIGGNHESSAYLKELMYGGWVAPNIYFLGEFGSVFFKGLEICGWSGIYNKKTFFDNITTNEMLPYSSSSIRTIYHSKLKNFIKMYLLDQNKDICLSHDWPRNIEKNGDLTYLLKKKPFFKNDIKNCNLGSPLNEKLLYHLKPRFWFSAHLHVKFEADVLHDKNSNEIDQFMILNDSSSQKNILKLGDDISNQEHSSTKFLSLDKCVSGRKFIESINIIVQKKNENHPSVFLDHLYYDQKSVIINQVVENYINNNKDSFQKTNIIDLINNTNNNQLINHLREMVKSKLRSLSVDNLQLDTNFYKIPFDNFKIISPTSENDNITLKYWNNNQTIDYCKKFGIDYASLT